MDVSAVSGTSYYNYPRQPAIEDITAVLAARPSMAEMQSRAAAAEAANQNQLKDDTRKAVEVTAVSATGGVDMYL